MRFRYGDKVKRVKHVYTHFDKNKLYTVHSYDADYDILRLVDGPILHKSSSIDEEWEGNNFQLVYRNEPITEEGYYKWLADRNVT